jgi:hypothetical protein
VLAPFGLLLTVALAAAGQSQPPPELPRVDPPPLSQGDGEQGDDNLRPVPFPAEGESVPPPPARHRRIHTTIADLRDPFAQQKGYRVKRRRGVPVRLLLPDLKDPFRATARVQPKNWRVPRVPGDIRDPFSPALRKRSLRKVSLPGCEPRTTDDGVLIQRPSALEKEKSKRAETSDDECIRVVPKDLRDPFAKRGN